MLEGITKLAKHAGLAAAMGLVMTLAAPQQQAQAQSLTDPPHYEDVPGCNQRVKDVMKYVSQVNAIRDIQLVEETLLKPESVFHMTCFARGNNRDQINNAAQTRRDRYLWTTGTGRRHGDRADRKVRRWSINRWLNWNYNDNIIDNEVAENCTSEQRLWAFLTGNGAKRVMLEMRGSPNPGAGMANRPDEDFYLDMDAIWQPPPTDPTDAWGIRDQQGPVINALADNNIDRFEDDIFGWTNSIQGDIIDIAERDFSAVEDPFFGCTGNACLTSQDLLDLFNNITP